MGRKKNSSDFLKECIADALFILLRTKSIESITSPGDHRACQCKPDHLLQKFYFKGKCH